MSIRSHSLIPNKQSLVSSVHFLCVIHYIEVSQKIRHSSKNTSSDSIFPYTKRMHVTKCESHTFSVPLSPPHSCLRSNYPWLCPHPWPVSFCLPTGSAKSVLTVRSGASGWSLEPSGLGRHHRCFGWAWTPPAIILLHHAASGSLLLLLLFYHHPMIFLQLWIGSSPHDDLRSNSSASSSSVSIHGYFCCWANILPIFAVYLFSYIEIYSIISLEARLIGWNRVSLQRDRERNWFA